MILIEPDAVARIDADIAASGIPGFQLMDAAGRAVAAAVLKAFPGALRVVILAGPGNNGGDAYVAAKALAESGCSVEIFVAFGLPMRGDAELASRQCGLSIKDIALYAPGAGDVIIDGIFGAGLSRDIDEPLATVFRMIGGAGAHVVAIDMPSGVCGHAGLIRGAALKADITVTFMALKPGQLLLPGRELCGRIEIADIGIPAHFVKAHRSSTELNDPGLWRAFDTPKSAASHKYSHGSVGVFSGGASATGAARLAAMSALTGGAGAVTVASPEDAMAAHAAHLTAVMLKCIPNVEMLGDWLADPKLTTFVLGPGFGIGAKARDFAIALAERRLVLDADGLTSFERDPDELFTAFGQGDPHLILTPHEGEFRRLFPDIAADTALSKVDKTKAAAKRANAAVIYKGADSVIAAPDGRAAINTNAPPWLATAGSGDVLAGLCAAGFANGWPAYEAACAAVWRHGEAGNRAGPGLTAETLINSLNR
jgi:NAD(P)H-hydrate epimerase